MKLLCRKLRNCAGAEIAEAALVMPVVFLFLLGIVWFGRAFNIYSTITQAAQQGAITAARPACATCGNNFATDSAVTNAVFAVMQASNLDPAQIPVNSKPPAPVSCSTSDNPPPACSTTANNVTICREVLLNSAGQVPVCGTIVGFQYPFQFYLPFTSLNLAKVTLTAEAQSRMEN